MTKHKIKMKTHEMDKHCNLLLNRILEECDMTVEYGKDELGVSAGISIEDKRVILLGFTKLLPKVNGEYENVLRIVLSDDGPDSVLDSYIDDISFNKVHDVSIEAITIKRNGEYVNFDVDDLKEVNNKVLSEINSTVITNEASFCNREVLLTKKSIVKQVKSYCN